MEIEIDQIPEEGLHLSYEVDPLSLETDGSLPFQVLSPVRVALELLKIEPEGAYMVGDVSAKVSSECSRCLSLFPSLIEATFHLECRAQSSSHFEKEYLLPREELDVLYYSADKIDVDREVLGQLVLSVPMTPLCGPECRGLCFECGENLNHSVCHCRAKNSDLCWADLQNFVHKETHAESKT